MLPAIRGRKRTDLQNGKSRRPLRRLALLRFNCHYTTDHHRRTRRPASSPRYCSSLSLHRFRPTTRTRNHFRLTRIKRLTKTAVIAILVTLGILYVFRALEWDCSAGPTPANVTIQSSSTSRQSPASPIGDLRYARAAPRHDRSHGHRADGHSRTTNPRTLEPAAVMPTTDHDRRITCRRFRRRRGDISRR